jgi:hypothetical protein
MLHAGWFCASFLIAILIMYCTCKARRIIVKMDCARRGARRDARGCYELVPTPVPCLA